MPFIEESAFIVILMDAIIEPLVLSVSFVDVFAASEPTDQSDYDENGGDPEVVYPVT